MALYRDGYSSYGYCRVVGESAGGRSTFWVYVMDGKSKYGPYASLEDAIIEFNRYMNSGNRIEINGWNDFNSLSGFETDPIFFCMRCEEVERIFRNKLNTLQFMLKKAFFPGKKRRKERKSSLTFIQKHCRITSS